MNNRVTPAAIMQQARGEAASQATVVEQSRAVAEVQAAYTIAKRFPRDEAGAIKKVIESCGQRAVAEMAFYKFPRAGQTVAGESIHLARELARCWGNMSFGISELARDDAAGMSEMMAFARDLETNNESVLKFLSPHKRDKRGGAELLTDLRDIYELNTNLGSRRLRECIFALLPSHVKEAAKRACLMTLERGEDGKPLPVRIAEAISAFEKIGISKGRLETKAGPSAQWTEVDVAQLQVSFRSIKRSEVSADEEFPRVGVEETITKARAIASSTGAVESVVDQGEGPDDSQMGEANAEATGDADLQRLAIDVIRRAAVVASQDEFDDLEIEVADRLSEMPPRLVDEVNDALDEAKIRISRTNSKSPRSS